MGEISFKDVTLPDGTAIVEIYRGPVLVDKIKQTRRGSWEWTFSIDSLRKQMRRASKHYSRRFVNVYSVTRHYGGPEEGGWWYNVHEYIKGYKFASAEEAEAKLEEIRSEMESCSWGDINSVCGGEKYVAYLESRYAESKTRERPYYC